MSKKYESIPRNFANEQWLGVLAEQNDEIIKLLTKLVEGGQDSEDKPAAKAAAKSEEKADDKPAAKAEEISEPAKSASRSTTARATTARSSSADKKS